MNENK